MPIKIERKLKRSAAEHGYRKGTKEYGAYVYGTLNKIENNAGKKKRNHYKASK
jgi:hypothetical protein